MRDSTTRTAKSTVAMEVKRQRIYAFNWMTANESWVPARTEVAPQDVVPTGGNRWMALRAEKKATFRMKRIMTTGWLIMRIKADYHHHHLPLRPKAPATARSGWRNRAQSASGRTSKSDAILTIVRVCCYWKAPKTNNRESESRIFFIVALFLEE